MKEDLLKIIEHYGVMPQLKYFQSEVFELNEAVLEKEKQGTLERIIDGITISFSKAFGDNSNDINLNHIEEEIADVLVMLKQIQYFYKIPDEKIAEIMKYKIERQLKRIEEEKECIKNCF